MSGIQDKTIGEIIENFKYVIYGFGISLGIIFFLIGVIFKFWTNRLKRIESIGDTTAALRQQVEIQQHDIDALKDHETGRNSFSRGLYAVSEKLTNFKLEQDNLKEMVRDVQQRCERRHFETARYDGLERRRQTDREEFEHEEVIDDIEIRR